MNRELDLKDIRKHIDNMKINFRPVYVQKESLKIEYNQLFYALNDIVESLEILEGRLNELECKVNIKIIIPKELNNLFDMESI